MYLPWFLGHILYTVVHTVYMVIWLSYFHMLPLSTVGKLVLGGWILTLFWKCRILCYASLAVHQFAHLWKSKRMEVQINIHRNLTSSWCTFIHTFMQTSWITPCEVFFFLVTLRVAENWVAMWADGEHECLWKKNYWLLFLLHFNDTVVHLIKRIDFWPTSITHQLRAYIAKTLKKTSSHDLWKHNTYHKAKH